MDTIEAPRGGYVLVRIAGSWGRSDGGRFYLGRCPVTNEEYGRYLCANPTVRHPIHWQRLGFDDPRQPVVGVTWHDAMGYCRWAGLGLPTEAQWEDACRRGTDPTRTLDDVAWYAGNSNGRLHPVACKEANALGLYDMLGNIWEWCLDEVEEEATDDTVVRRRGSGRDHGSPRIITGLRVVRGGSWRSSASRVSAQSRVPQYPALGDNDTGFRAVLITSRG